MKIFLGADHAGFELKEKLKVFLEGLGHEVKDFGAFSMNPDDDYPDFVRPVAEAISQDPENSRGIVLGASGQGEAMICNRAKGVRAAVYYGGNMDIVKLSREHNNANVLSFGARFVSEDETKKAVELWLATSFAGGRHERRVKKMDS